VLCPPFRTFFPYPDVGRRGVVINLLGRHPRRGYVRTLRARRRRSMFDVRCSTFDARRSTLDVRRLTLDVRRLTLDV
jgi:hypothetical protein